MDYSCLYTNSQLAIDLSIDSIILIFHIVVHLPVALITSETTLSERDWSRKTGVKGLVSIYDCCWRGAIWFISTALSLVCGRSSTSWKVGPAESAVISNPIFFCQPELSPPSLLVAMAQSVAMEVDLCVGRNSKKVEYYRGHVSRSVVYAWVSWQGWYVVWLIQIRATTRENLGTVVIGL